ncbi:cupin domain-containing protein [Mesorhizobium sp. DCY119]|uniref:cupin domain-containing protein n=1 Tax=Mesorhizobium sp. DCY119 TaxID=2108445 RepID=UPI0014021E35|nr:cupin domain-containing protein [Mesorhizobium sp. DCY119]
MTDETALQNLYDRAAAAHMQPLWVNTKGYVPREPAPAIVTAHWPADTSIPLLRRAGEIVSSEFADRRVLVCNNPALPPFSPTTQTLYACIQLLLPGEKAAPHRHSQNALRFILQGEGADTIVNDKPVRLRRGDVVITPAWAWHGHVNTSNNDMVWIDGLDNAVLKLFDATFFELPPHTGEIANEVVGPANTGFDPDWHFKWHDTETLLREQQASGDPDAAHGCRRRLLDPKTNSDPLPTIAAHMTLLPEGFRGQSYRSSDSVIYVVMSGEGRTTCEGEVIDWKEGDIFTIPTWKRYSHQASSEAVLFSISDRAAQEKLRCWREQRGDGPVQIFGLSG